ncbi:MAG: DinB family protein [Chloroflexota bacterium]|nr:DinB family protein [Chloroflexota bacterium]
MSRILLDHTIWDMGQAFDGLFANLKDLADDDWTWVPPGGARSIRAIVGHIASCKLMYDNHAFGDASLTWMDPRFNDAQSPTSDDGFTPGQLVDWWRETDLALRKSVDALEGDDELARDRRVNWGGTRSTRWILSRLIQHDSFHAGEINHIRALHQRNDRWEWEQTE